MSHQRAHDPPKHQLRDLLHQLLACLCCCFCVSLHHRGPDSAHRGVDSLEAYHVVADLDIRSRLRSRLGEEVDLNQSPDLQMEAPIEYDLSCERKININFGRDVRGQIGFEDVLPVDCST